MLRIAEITCRVAKGTRSGVRLAITEHGSRPSLRLEAAPGRRLRLMSGDASIAYIRIDEWWEELSWLSTGGDAARAVKAIDTAAIRAIAGPPREPSWWLGWMRHFAAALDELRGALFYDGLWAMAPVPYGTTGEAAPYPRNPADGMVGPPGTAHGADRTTCALHLYRDDWARGWADEPVPMGVLWPLRAPLGDAGRLNAWRKHARAGTLPPILVQYVSVIGAYLVIDGHARLRAALAEQTTPPLIAMWPSREPPARDATRFDAVTRAFRLAGGGAEWDREARAVAARCVGLDADDVGALLEDP